jgi:rhamnosyltransferase
MNNNIALGFILFNPSTDIVKRIINAAKPETEVFIVLNSRLDDSLLSMLSSIESIHLIGNGSNVGLSMGLKSLCNEAYIKYYSALLYFDQDSIFTSETLDYVLKYYRCILDNDNEFTRSIVCTTFRDTTVLNRANNYISTAKISDFVVENVYFTINSGSLYFLDKFNKYVWFDKRFFVDGVDYSFCLRSRKNKFRITEIYNTPGLDHETDQGNLPVKFFGKQKSGRLYPFSRNIDFIKSHLMILFLSSSIKSIKPKIFIIKSICGYIYMQILFRIKSMGTGNNN